MNIHILTLLNKAIHQNILCYDHEADCGVFSKELEKIMTGVLLRHFNEQPMFIIKDDFSIMKNYYKITGCNFAPGKEQLVMMVSQTNAVLGAY